MKSSAAGIRSLSKSSVLCLLSFLLLLGFMQVVAAQTPEEKGFLIAKQNDASDVGFGDSVVDGTMVLRNAAGSETIRNLEIRTLEVNEAGLGDRSLIIFNRPRDINGTALLSHTKVNDTDDQWIFLPALKRTKRIASKNKSGPFVGSEFAFEDFTSSALDKFKYRYLKTEACGSLTCDVIERVPVDRFSGYSRQEAWIDQQDHQLRRIDFFDRKKSLLKTLKYEDYRQYNDKYWRAHKLLMFNHQTDKSTDLISEEFAFQKGLRKRDFVRGILTQLR